MSSYNELRVEFAKAAPPVPNWFEPVMDQPRPSAAWRTDSGIEWTSDTGRPKGVL